MVRLKFKKRFLITTVLDINLWTYICKICTKSAFYECSKSAYFQTASSVSDNKLNFVEGLDT